MKLLLPLLFCVTFNTLSFSQLINVSFEKSEMEYQSLIGATPLTQDFTVEDWEGVNMLLDLDTPIFMETNEGDMEFYSVIIYSGGELFLAGINPITLDFADVFIAPLDEILGNTYVAGSLMNHTEINYLFQDSISYFEFKNLTFGFEEFQEISPEARFNVTVSIDHRDATMTYSYGSSNYNPQVLTLLDEGLAIGVNFFLERENSESSTLVLLNNNPSDPDLLVLNDPTQVTWNGLNAFPEENTLYSFSFSDMTSQTLEELDFNVGIFPNPGTDHLNIQIEDIYTQGNINIFNSIGQIVVADLPFSNQHIDTKDWTPGLYTIRLSTSEGYQTIKWMKI